MVKNSYIYKHTRLDTGEIFYIGMGTKTKQDIRNNTYSRSFKRGIRSKFWYNVINKTNYKIDIIFDNLTFEEAERKEIRLIKLIGRRNLNLGSLCNLTDGGGGVKNIIKIGKPHTKQTKEKISNSNKLIIKSKEWIEKIASKHFVPIYCLDNENNKISFNSLRDAALFVGDIKYRKNICACLKNKRPTAYGYKWFYTKER